MTATQQVRLVKVAEGVYNGKPLLLPWGDFEIERHLQELDSWLLPVASLWTFQCPWLDCTIPEHAT